MDSLHGLYAILLENHLQLFKMKTRVWMFMVGCAHLSRWAGAQVFCTRLNRGQLAAVSCP